MAQSGFQKTAEKKATSMAEHPARERARCRYQQQDFFQCPTNFTGPASLKYPNGTVPFSWKSLSASTVTLLGAALGCRMPISRDQVCYRLPTSICPDFSHNTRRIPADNYNQKLETPTGSTGPVVTAHRGKTQLRLAPARFHSG